MSVNRPNPSLLFAELKSSTNFQGLSRGLGFEPKRLGYMLKKARANPYTSFEVSKKSGGKRVIHEPNSYLMTLQSRLAWIIKSQVARNNKAAKGENWSKTLTSHGTLNGTGTISNALRHCKQKIVFNVDLRDFFPSIHAGRIKGFLLTDARFEFTDYAASFIASIATKDGALPQGSPLSPILADLIAGILDARIAKLCSGTSVLYSRYVDDLTFSNSTVELPNTILRETEIGLQAGERLENIIVKSGFTLNLLKTRISYYDSRMTVTGLVVNNHPNIPANYFRNTKAMYHNLIKNGHFYKKNKTSKLTVSQIRKLRARSQYIFHVRECERIRTASNITDSSDFKLLKRIMFSEYFGLASRAIILCEGSTDHQHLRAARKALKFKFIKTKNGDGQLSEIRLRELSAKTKDVFGLGKGGGGLKEFIVSYKDKYDHIKTDIARSPVFVLFDSDNERTSATKMINGKYKLSINPDEKNFIFNVYGNLYVVFLPCKATESRVIEQMYPESLLDKKIDGRSLSLANKDLEVNQYGKGDFLQKVVRVMAKKSDFSNFEKLFDEMNKALINYS